MSFFRQYSPNKYDLATLFLNVSSLLRCVTLNIYQDAKRPAFWCYLLTYSAIVAYVYVYIFSMVWFSFIRCRETGDIVAAFVIFSEGCNSGTCVTKFISICLYSKTIDKLVSQYLECDAQVVPGSRFHCNLMKVLKVVKQRAIGIWVALMGMAALYILRPVVWPGRHFPQDIYVLYGLEPKFETPNYEISFLLMTLSIAVGVYIISTVKALVVIMVGYIEAVTLALTQECFYIWNDAEIYMAEKNINDRVNNNRDTENNNSNEIINEEIRLKLKFIIAFHVSAIKNLQDFEKFYRLISFADFAFIVLAIIAELLGKIENSLIGIPYTFTQIFIDCYIGQKLTDANNLLEAAIYDCKWENFNPKNRKMVLMLLRSSQKAITVTAGGVSPLNYVTLISIVKTTYSAYTTLQSSIS